MWTKTMTLEEARTFLRDMMELQMWYCVYVVRHQDSSFREAVNRFTELYPYCNVYRKETAKSENAEYQKLVGSLEQCWNDAGDEAFPSRAWELIEPNTSSRLRDILEPAKESILRSFAGFTYEFHPEYAGPETPDWLTLHFRNYFAPDSPFQHVPELVAGLLEILENAQRKRPKVTQVQCASWLNNLEPFQKLFPEEWMTRSSVCSLGGNLGWWGQFIDRTGQLHQRNAALFRETGEFLYPNRHCRCERDHLKTHLLNMQ
jgi:hypothetical protein